MFLERSAATARAACRTKSAGGTLDTQAFDIVTGMPRWKPGTTNGEPVDKPASVTVHFGAED
ncbi:MAG: hypothetical protein IJR02_01410 [Bacteroidaceae bacterium]|nr:hypothetical protein [Bacteroidaceae bacterium]